MLRDIFTAKHTLYIFFIHHKIHSYLSQEGAVEVIGLHKK